MKLPLLSLIAVAFAAYMPAQTPNPPPAYTPEQLDQLLAPIALYPDPLIAIILPATTVPADIVMAARFLSEGGSPAMIDDQPWDESVRALARYPDVIRWLDSNLRFTRAAGEAFQQQPAEVMRSVQRLRARALAAGTLGTAPHQVVVREGTEICILPAEDNLIYVPQYDPELVYAVPPGYAGPFFGFGVGFAVGPWLCYSCNWDDFGIWVGLWHPHWGYYRDWRNPGPDHRGTIWRPDPRWERAGRENFRRPAIERVMPAPMRGAPLSPRRPPAPAPRENIRESGGHAPAPARAGAPENRPAPAARTAPERARSTPAPTPSQPSVSHPAAPSPGGQPVPARGTATPSREPQGARSNAPDSRPSGGAAAHPAAARATPSAPSAPPARSDSRPSGSDDRKPQP